MGEVKGVSGFQACFDGGPQRHLGGIGDQVFDYRSLLGGFLDWKKGFAGDESVSDSLVPRFRILALADNHIYPIVAHVERLSGALDAVTDHGNGFLR